MTELEFYCAVCKMVADSVEAGGEPEVLIVPCHTVVEEDNPLTLAGDVNGGMEVLTVATDHGNIRVIKDKWCPPDKWYLTDWTAIAEAKQNYYDWVNDKLEPFGPEVYAEYASRWDGNHREIANG